MEEGSLATREEFPWSITPGDALLAAEGNFHFPSESRDDEVSRFEPLAVWPPFHPQRKLAAETGLSLPEPADGEVGGEEADRETWGD